MNSLRCDNALPMTQRDGLILRSCTPDFLNVKCYDACSLLSHGLVEMEEGERKHRDEGC